MLRLVRAADDSTEAIDVPTRTIRRALDPSPNASETARVKPQQLALFPPCSALPSRPFSRWHRKFDELRVCAKCGREIIAKRRTAQDEVLSEIVSDAGECLWCDSVHG
jgi:hypothetical protein